MVVSCQKRAICFIISLCIVLSPVLSFAQAQELTDDELDTIVASNFANDLTESLEPLSNLSSFLDPEVLKLSGLVQVHAVDSEVVVQTNIISLLQSYGININQSNVYSSSSISQ